MKKMLSFLVAAALMAVAVPAALAADAEPRYRDVPASFWAYEAVERVSLKRWFNGYPDGRFMPNNQITRGEAMKVFVEFLGLEVKPVAATSYYDVAPNLWCAPHIEAGKGLFPTHTTVQGKTPFQPNMPVTREDTMYALVKALGYDADGSAAELAVLDKFSDAHSISANCRACVATAVARGLVAGMPDGTIRGQDPLTRAEFATLLARASGFGFGDAYEEEQTAPETEQLPQSGRLIYIAAADGEMSVLDKDGRAKTVGAYKAYLNGTLIENFVAKQKNLSAGYYYGEYDTDNHWYVLSAYTGPTLPAPIIPQEEEKPAVKPTEEPHFGKTEVIYIAAADGDTSVITNARKSVKAYVYIAYIDGTPIENFAAKQKNLSAGYYYGKYDLDNHWYVLTAYTGPALPTPILPQEEEKPEIKPEVKPTEKPTEKPHPENAKIIYIAAEDGETSVLDKDGKAKTVYAYEAYIDGVPIENFVAKEKKMPAGYYYSEYDADNHWYILAGNEYTDAPS